MYVVVGLPALSVFAVGLLLSERPFLRFVFSSECVGDVQPQSPSTRSKRVKS